MQQVALTNVRLVIDEIQRRSPLLVELLDRGDIGIVGAMYDVQSGKVDFL